MIRHKEKELEGLRARAIGGGSSFSGGEKVQTSIGGRQMDDKVAEYVDLEAEIEMDVIRYREKRNEIINAIHMLENPKHIIVLHAKWIDGDSLERIAADTYQGFHYVRKLYTSGMKEMDMLLASGKIPA